MNFGNSSEDDILSIEEWNNFVDKVKTIEFPIEIRADKLFDFDSVDKLIVMNYQYYPKMLLKIVVHVHIKSIFTLI